MNMDRLYDAAIAGDAVAMDALKVEADKLHRHEKLEGGDYWHHLGDSTILHIESTNGNTEHVRFILREFAHKNLLVKLDSQKKTALSWASYFGHTQVAGLLVDAARHFPYYSANDSPFTSFQDFLRHHDMWSNTALHFAAQNGYPSIARLLVEADPSATYRRNVAGKTPMYLAAERGYTDILKMICTTCTALSNLDGPVTIKNGYTSHSTALHVAIKKLDKVAAKEKQTDVVGMIINAAKRSGTPPDASFEALFNRTDESGCTVLELSVMGNHVNAVDLILKEDPAYQDGRRCQKHGLMRLIYKAIDEEKTDIVELLSKTYDGGAPRAAALILAIKRRDKDFVLRVLEDDRHLATFAEDEGWTPLHYAADHEFDSILAAIIEAQKDSGYPFVYEDKVQTPLLVAAEKGYTSIVIRLMELWPTSSSAAYTAINSNSRNILHLAAAANKKMVQGILEHCPEKDMDKILKQQDINGDTPLHLLISHGCFIPKLIKHKGLDTMVRNNRNWTPRDMLYSTDDVKADQVKIKMALDHVQTNQSRKFWRKNVKKETDSLESLVPPSKRETKDVEFNKTAKVLKDEERAEMKKGLERYKKRTSTQIVVATLITTVTFTVGFTMPGGLRQSGADGEGMVVLSKKAAFNAFMVSDALAFLLSTCSLFLYFLESMYEEAEQVSKLNAASVGLNIVSVVAMMLTFITGTYVVLSRSPVLAITVCLIGSFFFIFVIVLLIKLVHDRHMKKE